MTNMFAIYKKPKDYPDHFVVREWRVTDEGKTEVSLSCKLATTLDEARTHVPPGYVATAPNLDDDPVIAEVWI